MDDLLNLFNAIELPDTYPYLMAILGLVFIWKFHDMQVKAGRIQAKDLWEKSGVRLFLNATPDDLQACLACKETTNYVFLPSLVASKKFTPHTTPCTNPSGCRCVMIGLYGGWAEAGAALAAAKKANGKARLSDAEITALIGNSSSARAGASADRISLRMLSALRSESSQTETAMEQYRAIIAGADEDRDRPFIVPSYLRLSALQEQSGNVSEARRLLEQCLRDSGAKKKGLDAPTDAQRTLLNKNLARLTT